MLARVVTVAAVGALATLGLSGSVLVGGIAWSVALLFVASGWGFLVARGLRISEPDFGLRAVWGLAGYLAVAGVLLALGLCARPAILGMVGVGFAGFAWRELTTLAPLWSHAMRGWQLARARPALAGVVVLIAAIGLLRLLSGVAHLNRNPWDDDLAYTPFVKRLLDIGDLVEPFSFRRLGAYGGQSALQALAAARGQLGNIHLLDRTVCQALTMLLLVGYARERKTPAIWFALLALIVVLMPDISINTASYWSGAAFFLALYRTVVLDRWTMAGLLAAATSTLRMNYLAIAVIFLVAALLFRRDRRAWVQTLVGGAALVPWAIAAFISSRTFLFPLMEGTWNHALSLRQGDPTWLEELRFMTWCVLETSPVIIWPPIAVALLFIRDIRLARPLSAFLIATAIGFLMLTHSLVGAQPSHVWRYAFGCMTTLLLVAVVEVRDDGDVSLAPLGRWLLLACLVLQLLVGRSSVPKELGAIFEDVAAASHGDPESRAEARRYSALQAATPPGTTIAVMVDDPEYLDFARNPIVNLDTPGFASIGTWPGFAGPDALRGMLVGLGYQYLAFVRPDASRYFFRREFWIPRMFTDTEFFEIMSAYTIDTIDSCVALAKVLPVRFDQGGLVVLQLTGDPVAPPTTPEPARREAWMKRFAAELGLADAATLLTREDVKFDDGLSAISFIDPHVEDPHWYEMHVDPTMPPLHGLPARWMHRRSHLRVRGDGPMQFSLRGKLNPNALFAHPRLLVTLDGDELAEIQAAPDGTFSVTGTVTVDRDWHHFYLVFSSIGEPERDLHDLRMAQLETFEWTSAR